MKKRVLFLIVGIFLIMFFMTNSTFAATKLLDWDFNNATYIDASCGDVGNNCDQAKNSGYWTIGTTDASPQGGNYARCRVCVAAACGGDYTQPTLIDTLLDNPLTEFYVSYWYLVESDLNDCVYGTEIESIKQVRMHVTTYFDGNDNDALCLNWYPSTWHIYHPGSFSDPWVTDDVALPATWDTWIKIEVYAKLNSAYGVSDGALKIWYTINGQSRVLSYESTSLQWKDSGESPPYWQSFGVLQHVKTFGSACYNGGGSMDGHVRIDDVELWDGMPTSTPECSDTLDNDGDGAIDFSGGDTGCDDANDDDESNCGDLVCEGGETCLTCVSDCPTNAGEVCCVGTIYTGDCCDDTDCAAPETCANHVCALPQDTIVSVDSTYSGYSTSVIDDEVIDPYGGTATTWASGTSAVNPHWITINFSQSRDINNVTIYWAFNSGQSSFMSSQEVQVQYWDGLQYITAATITNTENVQVSSITFPTISTLSLRLWQPANMGSVYYTSIIWLTEVDYSSGSICSPADSDTDGSVSITEIMNYITQWKAGSVTISALMTGIGEWKNGC